ncbi:MAG: glycosyltransferase family 4 protein [Clostridia bacterium]|nr:glycosyltransferase family 4 protein [Clostridia bacterium]
MFPKRDDGIILSWWDYIEESGYELILFDINRPDDELSSLLLKIIEEKKIDLIHSHFSCLYEVLLWNKELHSKVKILMHDHMDYVAEQPEKPQKKKQRKAAKRYREYGIGVVSVMKKKHRGYRGVPNRYYVPNGITFKRNVERSLTREEYREKLGLSENDKFCLFLGWSIYGKGIDIALNALISIREIRKDFYLGIIGFGSNPSDEQIEKIQKVVGFDPRVDGVRFLDSEEDMFALHRAADVYLSASRTEAFSYGILEAISQNVPTVVSDIPGTKWSWKYSKCFKFKNEDVDGCSAALLKAVETRNDDSNRAEMIEKYSIDKWCDKMIKIYDKFTKR